MESEEIEYDYWSDYHQCEQQDEDSTLTSTTKVGRRYELQRKIDEELRKLQEADGMDVEENHSKNNEDSPVELKAPNHQVDASAVKENGLLPHQPVINDYKLDAAVEAPVDQNDFMEGSGSEEAIHILPRDEIDTSTESKRNDVEESKSNNVDALECSKGPILELKSTEDDIALSEGLESDNAVRSSTMTSPTTTTGTFTLPLQSPGTEGDITEEMLPVDQHPPGFQDVVVSPSGEIGTSEAPYEEVTAVENITSEKYTTFEASDAASQDAFNIGISVDANIENSNAENMDKSQEALEVGISKETDLENQVVVVEDEGLPVQDTQGEKEQVEADLLKTRNDGANEIVEVVQNSNILMENVPAAENENEICEEESASETIGTLPAKRHDVTEDESKSEDIVAGDNAETAGHEVFNSLDTEVVEHASVQETVAAHDVPTAMDNGVEQNAEVPEKEKVESFSEYTQNIVGISTEQLAKGVEQDGEDPEKESVEPNSEYTQNAVDISEERNVSSEQDVSDADRKFSTDEDEYSGYDIDMGGPASFQEETSIAEEESIAEDNQAPEEYIPMQACDNENEPLFADVRYSVGEQIKRGDGQVDELEDNERTPTEDKEMPDYPQIVPWDSDGIARLDGSTPIQDTSFPSDKADTASSSSRSSLSEQPTFNEEAGAKIAEETVSSAIKAAYDICVQASGDEDVSIEGANVPDMSADGGNYSVHSVDNFAADEAEEIVADESGAVDTSSQIKGENVENLLSHSTEARENDITRYGESDEEKIAAVETAEVKQGHHIEESTALCLAVGKSDTPSHTEVVVQQLNGQRDTELSSTEQESQKESEQAVPNDAPLESVGTDIPPTTHEDNNNTSTELNPTEADESLSKKSDTISDDMVKVQESSGHTRDLPERITYNPALSQRNTEATKWFGQPTAENKIWMKPSGRVDENAELERKKLIKAMTRRHNPNLVPKWQPPKEKDFSESLDDKQKKSLLKYEERRRSRSDATTEKSNEYVPVMPPIKDPAVPPEPHAPQLPRENIVIESVVHSRDAIGAWESRLSEKQRKEDLEKQRLSVGKQKKPRERATSDVGRVRHDSSSSVSSNASGVLPTSEHIERDSMDVSKIRNRWKNIEVESGKPQPEPAVKKDKRRSNFTVNTTPTFRSYQSPAPAASRSKNVIPVNVNRSGPAVVRPSHQKESFIDREIREAAEREERWKQEQWEKMSEASAASSEEVFPDGIPTPSSKDKTLVATVYTHSLPTEDVVGMDIMKDADREDSYKAERNTLNTDADSGRHRSKDSSGIGSDIASPPPQRQSNSQRELDSESLSSYGSGIGPSSPPSSVNIVTEKVVHSGAKHSETPKIQENIDYAAGNKSSKVVPEIQQKADENSAQNEEDARVRRQRIASLTTPKGWEPNKGRAVGPVSPVSPVHRSVPKPEVKSPQSTKMAPVAEQAIVQHVNSAVSSTPPVPVVTPATQPINDNEIVSKPAPTSPPKNEDPKSPEVDIFASVSPPATQGLKKGGPVFQKKSGGPVGPVVTSSKSKLQSIMEKEMQDAAAREEEWRKKQLEMVNQGVDVSPHPVLHSTREIRTPTGATAPPPVNSGEQQEVKLRRPVKSLFADDDAQETTHIRDDASDEHKKRAVVKAMRVPKRKSQLAMRWEEGQFQNNVPDENE